MVAVASSVVYSIFWLSEEFFGILLAHDLWNQLAVHIRKAHVTAIESIREPGVIQAEQVQYRRVEVVNRHHLLLGLETELIAGADHLAALDTGACHPYSHCTWIVVAPDTS